MKCETPSCKALQTVTDAGDGCRTRKNGQRCSNPARTAKRQRSAWVTTRYRPVDEGHSPSARQTRLFCYPYGWLKHGDIYDRVSSLQGLEVTLRAVPVLRSLADFRLAMTIMRDTKRLQILHGQYGSMVGLLISLCQCDVRILSLRGSDIYWRYGDPKDRAGGLIRIIMSWIGCLRSNPSS